MRTTLLAVLALVASCAGGPPAARPAPSVVVEGVSFDGTGNTAGRRAMARVRNRGPARQAVEVRFRFVTKDGLELVETGESWTPIEIEPGAVRAVETVCPFSTASEARLLVRAR